MHALLAMLPLTANARVSAYESSTSVTGDTPVISRGMRDTKFVPPAPPSTCHGFGARLEARASRASTALEHHEIYTSFVDTAIRGFKGVRLIQQGLRVGAWFEAEAERFVERAWSVAKHGRHFFAGGNASSGGNASFGEATNASRGRAGDAARTNGTNASTATVLGGALSCLSMLYQGIMDKFDARPPSFIAEPPSRRANGLVLLSGGDRNAALSERVVDNHGAFARRHGYSHWWHRGNLASPYLAYWHKIAMLRKAVERFPTARAFAWVDDDIVFTNHHGDDMIERALALSNASVLVTRDPARRAGVARLNTGVMLVRRDRDGLDVLDEMWRRATAARDDGLSLAYDPQSTGCLHEQQALQEMLGESAYWRSKVGVLEQRGEAAGAAAAGGAPSRRADEHGGGGGGGAGDEAAAGVSFNMNTFLRWSHYHAERQETLRYDGDAKASGWLRGDFVGHCSGLSPVRRAICVAALLGAVIS